jgi:hypothetical protein
MSAQKSILSFFGARATPPPAAPPSKASTTTPPTVTSGNSDCSRPTPSCATATPPVTPVALGQKFTAAPSQTSQPAPSPGTHPLACVPSPSDSTFPSAVPSTPSFFAAFGSKHTSASKPTTSSKTATPSSSSVPVKRPSPAPVRAQLADDDDDDAPLVAAIPASAAADCSDDSDAPPSSAAKRVYSPSEAAAKFSRYTAGSSPIDRPVPAPRAVPTTTRVSGGGSGYVTPVSHYENM